jgi:hypothetical protein
MHIFAFCSSVPTPHPRTLPPATTVLGPCASLVVGAVLHSAVGIPSLSPTVPSKPFSILYIENIPFSIAPAAFSKWFSKIENATGFLYI